MERRKSRDQARSYILTLLMLADSDNYHNPLELSYIFRIANRLGLKDSHVHALIKNPCNVSYSLPETEVDRMQLLFEIMYLMKIDGGISKEERSLFRELGYLLTYNKLMVEEFLIVAEDHIDKEIPEGVLLDIIRKYKN